MEPLLLELTENLNKQGELFNTLLLLTQKQNAALHNDDAQGFLILTEERQRAMDEIDRLAEKKENLLKLAVVRLKVKDPHWVCFIRMMEDGIHEVLLKIEELNKENQDMANTRLAEYKKHLQDLRKMRKGIQSYVKPFYNGDGVYFDTKK